MIRKFDVSLCDLHVRYALWFIEEIIAELDFLVDENLGFLSFDRDFFLLKRIIFSFLIIM
jgi:hypothetical protein